VTAVVSRDIIDRVRYSMKDICAFGLAALDVSGLGCQCQDLENQEMQRLSRRS